MAVIVLDPGHGGSDSGAVHANGTRECDLARQFTARLASVLTLKGHQAVLPWWQEMRPTDTIRMTARAGWINAAHPFANLVVSVHLNACESHGAQGTECYYASQAGRYIAERVVAAACLGQNRNRGAKPGTWSILTKTRPVAVLLECAFVDNDLDLAWFTANCNRQAFSVGEVIDLMLRR